MQLSPAYHRQITPETGRGVAGAVIQTRVTRPDVSGWTCTINGTTSNKIN